jgi:hypothetical protein
LPFCCAWVCRRGIPAKAKATARANAGVLRYAQDDGEEQRQGQEQKQMRGSFATLRMTAKGEGKSKTKNNCKNNGKSNGKNKSKYGGPSLRSG